MCQAQFKGLGKQQGMKQTKICLCGAHVLVLQKRTNELSGIVEGDVCYRKKINQSKGDWWCMLQC